MEEHNAELQALVISLKAILCTNILCTWSEFDFSFGKHVFIFSPACSKEQLGGNENILV